MASEFSVDWYYRFICDTFFKDLFNKLFGSSDKDINELDIFNVPDNIFNNIRDNNLLELCKSNYEKCSEHEVIFTTQFNLKNLELKNIDKSFLEKLDDILKNFKKFIDENRYRIAYLYTLSTISKMIERINANNENKQNKFNNKVNINLTIDDKQLWTTFYISDAATDPNFDNILNILFGDNFSSYLESLDKVITFSKGIEMKNVKPRIIKMITESSEEVFKNEKEKIINELSAIVNNNELVRDFYDKLIEMFRKFVSYKPKGAGTNDFDEIIKILFKDNKILEIFMYKIIVNLGFPSIINIKFNEYEADIVTFIDKLKFKIIEVTTRKKLDNKIFHLTKLLDLLKENGIESNGLIIWFDDSNNIYNNDNITCFEESNNTSNYPNITILSAKKLFCRYPYNLLSCIYKP
ncbi:MAG: hypothetical protein KatS3mg003_2037 [Candidatus Nitrosocaldaceae archaeon]|nr:MAG: hypothetical protein KatS3mg003_2037 [Candidatus Nitrosocaldaceae archaeon]